MIVVSLAGGIGNQMFQYALGRHLAWLQKSELKLDISAYTNENIREYNLDSFNIQVNYIRNTYFSRVVYKIQLKTKYFKIYTEQSHKYQDDVFNQSDNMIINGYWQGEKYFKAIDNIIREDFSFKDEISLLKLPVAKKILQSNSIAVHIRRGDYISNELFNKVHGTCNIEYYEKSIAYIAKKVSSPFFYIFSDDMQWVKANLQTSFPHIYIDETYNEIIKTDKAIVDLFLISLCKHNIIANSSFSWWGAWLNNSSSKIVIAPREWFIDELLNTNDLLPETWIKM